MYRLSVHGEAGTTQRARVVEEKIAALFDEFVRRLEEIDNHGLTLAQFEGATGYHRYRGEDTTLAQTPDLDPPATFAPFTFAQDLRATSATSAQATDPVVEAPVLVVPPPPPATG